MNPDFQIPPEQQRLHEILTKIVTYQHTLPDGRAVEFDELCREGVLTPADVEFLTTHSVTYKPHRISDYHAGDMLYMPNSDGGCVFIGPCGPPLTKRTARLADFAALVARLLRLPGPQDALILHIEFTEQDGMAVAPEVICFIFRSSDWRQRLPAIRSIAAEYRFEAAQDAEVQGNWLLTYRIATDAAQTAAAAVTFLSRGCGFTDESEITYSAGALDAA